MSIWRELRLPSDAAMALMIQRLRALPGERDLRERYVLEALDIFEEIGHRSGSLGSVCSVWGSFGSIQATSARHSTFSPEQHLPSWKSMNAGQLRDPRISAILLCSTD
ncbi:MAG: hypothetical protein R2855_04695 [Thermomicrobiales bacterium]